MMTHLLRDLIQPPLADKQDGSVEHALRKLGPDALVQSEQAFFLNDRQQPVDR